MAMFGIAHTANTRVGNDFVLGVSGGERKRVTIGEQDIKGERSRYELHVLRTHDTISRSDFELCSAAMLGQFDSRFVKPLHVHTHLAKGSTGLDSANAVEFCKTLRTQCDVFGTSSCVAIYQAPQAAYDVGTLP